MSDTYPFSFSGHIDVYNSSGSGFGYYTSAQNCSSTTWSTITYHEYGNRYGDKFLCNYSNVVVDGFTSPIEDTRFCLGAISNCNRDLLTQWIRRRIGRGVQLTYESGDVFIESFSSVSIFVQDPLMLWQDKEAILENVIKVDPGEKIKIFSCQAFSVLLSQAFTQDYEAVYDMTDRCTLRASFAKGWGPDYRDQSIYQTPCWIETQMVGPLQWVDNALRQSNIPQSLVCGPSTWADTSNRQSV